MSAGREGGTSRAGGKWSTRANIRPKLRGRGRGGWGLIEIASKHRPGHSPRGSPQCVDADPLQGGGGDELKMENEGVGPHRRKMGGWFCWSRCAIERPGVDGWVGGFFFGGGGGA